MSSSQSRRRTSRAPPAAPAPRTRPSPDRARCRAAAPPGRRPRPARRRYRRGGPDATHAHYGLSGWSALGAGAPHLVVTFHGTDLRHPIVGPLSRLLARFVALPAVVSASLAREAMPGAGARRRVAVLPCGADTERFRPMERREA